MDLLLIQDLLELPTFQLLAASGPKISSLCLFHPERLQCLWIDAAQSYLVVTFDGHEEVAHCLLRLPLGHKQRRRTMLPLLYPRGHVIDEFEVYFRAPAAPGTSVGFDRRKWVVAGRCPADPGSAPSDSAGPADYMGPKIPGRHAGELLPHPKSSRPSRKVNPSY
jgi:hypothetical protein